MTRTVGQQVTGLALISILGVLLISFGIVLLTPAPVPQPISLQDAVAALQGQGKGLRSRVERVVLPAPPRGDDSAMLQAAIARALHVDTSHVQVTWVDERGVPAAAPAGQSVVRIAGRDAVVDVLSSGGFRLRWGGDAEVALSTPLPPFDASVRRPDGQWLTVRPREPLLSAWKVKILAAFLLSAVLLTPLALLSARRITRPIRSLADAAARAEVDETAQARIEGPSEVRAAAAAMNLMRDRLAREALARTHMLAAVAHDLRNPLTGLRLRAESATEPARSRMIADVDRMEAMIVQVLDYVRGRALDRKESQVDPAELLLACAEDAAERGEAVRIAEPLPCGLHVHVEPEGLRRALANLVDNALRYGTSALVSLKAEGKLAVLGIEDNGPGIPEAEMPRLLEPFQRLDHSRSPRGGGAGLGLAIADDFARRNGGVLHLVNRVEGGLRAELRLPLNR